MTDRDWKYLVEAMSPLHQMLVTNSGLDDKLTVSLRGGDQIAGCVTETDDPRVLVLRPCETDDTKALAARKGFWFVDVYDVVAFRKGV